MIHIYTEHWLTIFPTDINWRQTMWPFKNNGKAEPLKYVYAGIHSFLSWTLRAYQYYQPWLSHFHTQWKRHCIIIPHTSATYQYLGYYLQIDEAKGPAQPYHLFPHTVQETLYCYLPHHCCISLFQRLSYTSSYLQ